MKIGIMSMQRIYNYGSLMQSLSLKMLLESLGHEVCFVDYKVENCVQERNNFIKFLHLKYRRIKLNVKTVLFPIIKNKRVAENETVFKEFYSFLNIPYKYCYHSKVDLLLIGSDEVFNCLQTNPDVGFSMELFGKNNKAKRVVSYAASFGNTTYEKLCAFKVDKIVAQNLKNFTLISVRDINSYSLVKKLSNIEPVLHMDPVFVGNLENLSWKKINLKDYIIVYGYSNRFTTEEKISITEFAKSKGLKTLALYGEQDFCDLFIRARVDEIIPYFMNAKYVITETFHGTLFSIITHRPFVTIIRKSIDGSYGNEEKLSDLMKRAAVEDRVITAFDDIGSVMDVPINYEYIDSLRKNERKKTLDYLNKCLEGI